jgi:hypothetical protein
VYSNECKITEQWSPNAMKNERKIEINLKISQ